MIYNILVEQNGKFVATGTSNKCRESALRKLFPGHIERSKSSKLAEYVRKLDTGVEGTYFEWGRKPCSGKRGGLDWSAIKRSAKSNDIEGIPSYAYISFYNSLKSIARDHLQAKAIPKTVYVYWGPPGTGKSHNAWDQAGLEAYPKDPNTKFWDGYRGQRNVVIDEFRGAISISHILRWFDRYPTIVEIKGSSVALAAESIWVTSNLHPENWYLDLDKDTRDALLRRLIIIHFSNPFSINLS